METNAPQQQQQQQQQQNLPPGVESAYIQYGWGRPQVMLTLTQRARRKLMSYAVILLIMGPIIVGLTTACIVLKRYYIGYGYASGVLFIVTGCLGICASKSNNACGIKAVMILSIHCTIWAFIIGGAAALIAALMDEHRTVTTIVLEVILAFIGITGGILCMIATVLFCKLSCSKSMRSSFPTGPMCHGVVMIGQQQQQQQPGASAGPPNYSTSQQYSTAYQQQQPPPSYDTVDPIHNTKY